VIRGGFWVVPPREIRSANRWREYPVAPSDEIGFRVARDLER
jgi:formylglycine-generating enzyme required for sulfatase activity